MLLGYNLLVYLKKTTDQVLNKSKTVNTPFFFYKRYLKAWAVSHSVGPTFYTFTSCRARGGCQRREKNNYTTLYHLKREARVCSFMLFKGFFLPSQWQVICSVGVTTAFLLEKKRHKIKSFRWLCPWNPRVHFTLWCSRVPSDVLKL